MNAICRVAKVKGAGSISGKSEHNYRIGKVPNADPERQHLNHEYVLNYETLTKAIEGRIQNAGIQRVRQDAVKGMEFILAASPRLFKRNENGQVVGDYRNSEWVSTNLQFMKERYGNNLVAFTLHQDEKTPHIHAIVVPITTDNRLCAKELFTPKTLRQLQTDYAVAMKPFGLERGIEGSRAQHVSMKHIYGLQQQQRQQIEQQIDPIQQETKPLEVQTPGVLDLLNLTQWKQQQESQINAEYQRRLAEIQKAATIAQNAAVANAQAKEQVQVLQQRLETSERLKQANHERAEQATQKLAQSNQLLERVALLIDEKRLKPGWVEQQAQRARDRVLPQIETHLIGAVQAIKSLDTDQGTRQMVDYLQAKGYQLNAERTRLLEPKSGIQVSLSTTPLKGKFLGQLIGERQDQLRQQQLKPQPGQHRRRGPRLS
jgi:hypothetical protein